MAEFVSAQIVESVAVIRIDRPPLNAVSVQLLRELDDAARRACGDPAVRAVLVHGGPKVFAGGDDPVEVTVGDSRWVADRVELLGCLARQPLPVVAAIDCYAVGAGLELALGADRRVTGDNAKLALPQVRSGRGVSRPAELSALIGPARARDLALTGRFVGAEEALAMGLVDHVVAPDDVFDTAMTWAGQFADLPAAALARAKRSLMPL
jgi:enoyl-CoA hydratase